jgi:hypothetical protein
MSPPGSPGTADPPGDLLYFFLSYARLGPLPADPQFQGAARATGRTQATEQGPGVEVDPEVRKFFTELDAKIVERTGSRPPAGFYDHHIPFDADPRKALSSALSRTQVFIPLYSPNYLKTSWTRREQNAFRIRMTQQHQAPDVRTLPVLWTPVPSWTVDAEDQRSLERARDLVPGVPEYSENGLRALCLLPIYTSGYKRVLDHVAAKIIHLTKTAPAPPSTALDLDQIPETPTDDPSFIITVVTGEPKPAPGSPWHPYSGRQELPVTEHAVRTAERFGLAPLVVPFERLRGYLNNPALAVVDPRILRRPDGEERLRQAFRDLPIWVRPLVVGDDKDPTINDLARRAQQVLSGSVPAGSDPHTRAVDRVDGPQDLEAKLPLALAKTRQAYLRHGSYHLLPSSTPRPRLTSGGNDPLSGRESDVDH